MLVNKATADNKANAALLGKTQSDRVYHLNEITATIKMYLYKADV